MENKAKTRKEYYITTPIYYTSGNWHIGHCYTTVICDALARYKKMQGHEVFYLTGTDEHGEKIEREARKANLSERQFTDALVERAKGIWKELDICYDKFIRTSDIEHEQIVQNIFTKLYKKGDIYKAEYEGQYCVDCEAFWTKTQAKDNKCPDCGREVVNKKEESYFFRLSKYQDRVRKLLDETTFLEPRSRVNEMINNFIDVGLNDLAVTRRSVKWGVKVPFDTEHTIYVWIDALSNYITALGYTTDDESLLNKFWPADLQVLGKEITRFHAIIWPALLMALDLPMPKKLFAHGWLLFGGDKMSKSKGNAIDPVILSKRYGADAVRYFILGEVPFGNDAVYSHETFLKAINSRLVNDLSNLLSRSSALALKLFNSKVAKVAVNLEDADIEFVDLIMGLKDKVDRKIDALEINRALDEIFALVAFANKYIDSCAPWNSSLERAEVVLYNIFEALRVASILLKPFITSIPDKIFAQLGVSKDEISYENAEYGRVGEYNIERGQPVMMRLDIKRELSELAEIEKGEKKKEENGDSEKEKTGKGEQKIDKNADKKNEGALEGLISIDDFAKVELKTALVVACERVEKADKLLKLSLDVGGARRTVVSGIAKYYTPEEMVGKSVVLVANLKPVKLRGIESHGMILCASDESGKLCLVCPESALASGSLVR